jgi:hypothetical protein
VECEYAERLARRLYGGIERQDSLTNLLQAGGQLEAHYRKICPCYGFAPVDRIAVIEPDVEQQCEPEKETRSFAHGLHAYRVYKCRCEICTVASREARKRYRPLSDSVKVRLDGQPLIDRLTRDGRLSAVENSKISGWRKDGIGIYSADKWCIRLGYHPIEIWGQDFYVSIEPFSD